MARRWIGMAMIGTCLGMTTAVYAQYPPGASGPAALTEPMPSYPSAPPMPVPPTPSWTGVNPEDQNPPPLPGDGPTAWDDKPIPPWGSTGFFGQIGGMALQRARMQRSTLAVLDPQNLDTGTPPPPNAPVTVSFGDVPQNFAIGVRATVGYQWETNALEFTGFYIPENSTTSTTDNPGRLDSFFFNPPVGFEGDNGLWLQADRIRTSLRTALGDAEVNARWGAYLHDNFEWITGVRYFDLQERLSIFTDDDGLTILDINGKPDPLRQATYTVKTHSKIVAPQLGILWHHDFNTIWSIGLSAKGAWGANFVGADILLVRGDGLLGRAGHRDSTIFSHLYEVGLMADYNPIGGFHVRAGYDTLWIVNIPEASRQVDFNLEHTAGTGSNNGSIFFHGPTLEVVFMF